MVKKASKEKRDFFTGRPFENSRAKGGVKMAWIFLGLGIGIIAILILIPFLVWGVLAPSNRFFTFVQEGTAKIVVMAGRFDKAFIQWKGYTFDENWNVVPENTWVKDDIKVPEGTPGAKKYKEPWHPFGGLRFYGLWPLWDILVYRLRWHDLQRMEEKEGQVEKPVFHDEVLDYVLLREDVYWTKLLRAETGGAAGKEERIPLDVEFLTTMKVDNPYKAIFVAPIGWIENVLLRLTPLYRGFIASKTLDELLALKGKGEEIWKALTQAGKSPLVRQVFKDQWGIEIVEKGIQIKDIALPDEYQAAAARERTMELEAKGRAADVVGTVIAMLARARGKEAIDIQEEIEGDPALRKEFLELAKDLIVRKMGIEGGAYVDIRVAGAEGLERMILNAVAAWQQMPSPKQ